MMKCCLTKLLLSILGLTVILSPKGVRAQYDPEGIFIDCGGNGFMDEDENVWISDERMPNLDFPPGGRHITKSNKRIKGAKGEEILYRSERFQRTINKEMNITVGDIKPGLYEVRLHFAEIFFTAVNKRRFDVWVQEVEVYRDLDIYALVGSFTALTINAATRVTEEENEIRIRLDRVQQNQKIAGIEIRPIIELEEFQPIRINCGARQAYTDSLGHVWSADEYFVDERDLRWQTDRRTLIKETDDDELYLTERFSTRELMYEIPVPRGPFRVILHFAEIYYTGNGSNNKRVFNVFLEDTLAYESLDVYKEVGPNTAMKLALPASVNDGKLSIRLEPEKNSNGRFRYGQYPKISAIEILELKEVYKWNNYGRNGLTLVVMNALDEKWTSVFDSAVTAWSAGAPGSSSPPLKLLKVEVPPDPKCDAVIGRIKVCNGDYGDTKWVGLNTVTLQDGYIKNSVARMNDYYLSRSTRDQQNYAMCHEMGHACGLPHTDEDYFNKDSSEGDCLDYTIRPEKNKKPGKFNFKLLKQLYGQLNSNRRLDSDSGEDIEDDTPEDVQEAINGVVAALEKVSCEEYDRTSNHQVTQLENNEQEDACAVDLEGGYSVQIRKLRPTHWDLID